MEDFEVACIQEMNRRWRQLGVLVDAPYNYSAFRERSREVFVSVHILRQWHAIAQADGLHGLKPNWSNLEADELAIAVARYQQLGELADAETITQEEITALSQRLGWEEQRVERWLRRYREGGLYNLAPSRNVVKPSRPQKPRREAGSLTDKDLDTVYERRNILGDLALKDTVTDAEVAACAEEAGKSPRTIRYWHGNYRKDGLPGLARQPRSDKGSRHGVSLCVERLIIGLRLSKPDRTVRSVYEAVCKWADAAGETAPSEWQVRASIEAIDKATLLIADGREKQFRNKYRFTHRLDYDLMPLTLMVDHTPVDVLVKDLRRADVCTKSGEVRPYLTKCTFANSRMIVAARLTYDRPNEHDIAAVIREALLKMGIVDQISVDNGNELTSRHVRSLCRELGIKLHLCHPGEPQERGLDERLYRTLNTRLWADTEGYVGSNTVERNPLAKAGLAITGLEEKFWEWVDTYHQEIHSELGQTPLEHWHEHYFTVPVDPRELDLLLQKAESRRVIKAGIKFINQLFWHPALATFVGQDVTIRSEPVYLQPTKIEVFDGDGQWICTASVQGSEVDQAVTGLQVASAQHEQRETIRETIANARADARKADEEIKAKQTAKPVDDAASPPVSNPQPKPKKPKKSAQTDGSNKQNFWLQQANRQN